MTFDPSSNALAKFISSTGRPRRLDRMLMRCLDKFWKPSSIVMIGTTSQRVKKNGQEIELFASDHYALHAVFEVSKKE